MNAKHMLACAGLVVLAVVLFRVSGAPGAVLLPVAALVVCGGMMLVMVWAMARGARTGSPTRASADRAEVSNPEE